MNAASYSGSVSLVVFDVDGVLTDGRLYIGADGECVKPFHVQDGIAVALLRAHGVRSAILSGRHSAALTWRAKQLRMDAVVTGCDDKLVGLAAIKAKLGVPEGEIAYVGDDVNDICVIERVGVSYAPSNAHGLVRARVNHVVSRAGGDGVAREVAEHVLQAGGLSIDEAYRPLLEQWRRHDIVQ